MIESGGGNSEQARPSFWGISPHETTYTDGGGPEALQTEITVPNRSEALPVAASATEGGWLPPEDGAREGNAGAEYVGEGVTHDIATTAPAEQAPPSPLRDRMRAVVETLESRGIPLDAVLAPDQRRVLRALMSEGSYEEIAQATGADEPTLMYHAHAILCKANEVTAVIRQGQSRAPSVRPLSGLRQKINAAIAIAREHGINPSDVVEEDLAPMLAAVDGEVSNAELQQRFGLAAMPLQKQQEKVLRRLVHDPALHDRMPEVLRDALKPKPTKPTSITRGQ